jgi:hypothetical protein
MEKNDANNSPSKLYLALCLFCYSLLLCAIVKLYKRLFLKVEIWTMQVLRTSLMEVMDMLTAKLASSV